MSLPSLEQAKSHVLAENKWLEDSKPDHCLSRSESLYGTLSINSLARWMIWKSAYLITEETAEEAKSMGLIHPRELNVWRVEVPNNTLCFDVETFDSVVESMYDTPMSGSYYWDTALPVSEALNLTEAAWHDREVLFTPELVISAGVVSAEEVLESIIDEQERGAIRRYCYPHLDDLTTRKTV